MKTIQVLGSGCPKCKQLFDNTDAAARELGLEYKIEKVCDITEIIRLGVVMTPAVIVDGEIKSSGKLLKIEEVKALL